MIFQAIVAIVGWWWDMEILAQLSNKPYGTPYLGSIKKTAPESKQPNVRIVLVQHSTLITHLQINKEIFSLTEIPWLTENANIFIPRYNARIKKNTLFNGHPTSITLTISE